MHIQKVSYRELFLEKVAPKVKLLTVTEDFEKVQAFLQAFNFMAKKSDTKFKKGNHSI